MLMTLYKNRVIAYNYTGNNIFTEFLVQYYTFSQYKTV